MNKTEVLIQLPIEVAYWGSTATSADVLRLCDNLESMIRSEFGARLDLSFERTKTPSRGGVHSEYDDARSEVWQWIQDNWTAAL